jgi:hypothetical protein
MHSAKRAACSDAPRDTPGRGTGTPGMHPGHPGRASLRKGPGHGLDDPPPTARHHAQADQFRPRHLESGSTLPDIGGRLGTQADTEHGSGGGWWARHGVILRTRPSTVKRNITNRGERPATRSRSDHGRERRRNITTLTYDLWNVILRFTVRNITRVAKRPRVSGAA